MPATITRASGRRAKSVASSARSTPPWLQGLQRRSAPAGEQAPPDEPVRRSASIAYCEQLGWYLQVPAGVSRPNV